MKEKDVPDFHLALEFLKRVDGFRYEWQLTEAPILNDFGAKNSNATGFKFRSN